MNWIKKIKEKVYLPGFLFIMLVTFLGEVVLNVWTADPFLPAQLLTAACFGLAFGGVLGFIVSLLPKKIEKWVVVILTIVLSVLFLMEYFIYDAYHYFMPLSVVTAGAEGVVTGFLGTVLTLLGRNWWRIALFLVPILAYVLLTHSRQHSWKLRGILAGVAVVLYAISFCLVFWVTGDGSRLSKDYDFTNSVRCFGLTLSIPLEVINTSDVMGSGPQFEVPVTQPTQPTEPSTQPTDSTDPSENTAPTEPPVVYEPHAYDLDFAALAGSQTNQHIAALHSYVASLTPDMENEYTGLFAGKNLILITAEAFTGEFLDPELTPTLWRMANEGIKFNDYFQPTWGAGTTGGEYANLMGLMPNGGECMKEVLQQDMFLTMGNQLQKLGYSSAAYHNNDYMYYDRHKTHTLLGYDYYMGMGNGMEEGVYYGWTESDQQMFDFTLPMHLDKQPFSLYYMTVSGHAGYSQENDMAEKNYDKVKNLPYSETVKCYIACNLELENAMTSLLAQLEAACIADDTVVVISADHYPYGLASSNTWGTYGNYLDELYGENVGTEFIHDRNCLIIWSGCIEDMDIVVDDPVHSLDILPTLSNLFGLEYDSRLVVGRDVFSDSMPLVFWPGKSWKTDKGIFYGATGTFVPKEGVEVEEGYVDYVVSVVRNKIEFSRSVSNYDYYNYVLAELESTPAGE